MITIIAAVAADGIIGDGNKIPWRLKSDMEHFRKATTGHTVIMGRITWDSLDARLRPLPNRRNVVITRDPNLKAPGAEIIHRIEAALELTANDEQVFIIGGGEIFKQTMGVAERLLITRVHVITGIQGVIFPVIDPTKWNLVSTTGPTKEIGDDHVYHIDEYSRRLAPH